MCKTANTFNAYFHSIFNANINWFQRDHEYECILTAFTKVASDQGINVQKLKALLKEQRNISEQGTLQDFENEDQKMTLLQLLALNALDLTMPVANDLLFKERNGVTSHNWVQLSGHEGSLSPAGHGTVWKRRSPATDDTESRAYRALASDVARDLAPKFHKEVKYDGSHYIEMQDLLQDFDEPSVMDIKMGTRTFTESEVKNQTARPDLYAKMVAVDLNAATADERAAEAITKLRYMEFREQLSSTSTLGFRIEAVKYGRSPPVTNLKLVKSREQILLTLNRFVGGRERTKTAILDRLRTMREVVERSPLLQTREIIGSSILIVYDQHKAGAWMIDFAKTLELPVRTKLDHRTRWTHGNHEDGYLTGLDNLIEIFEHVATISSSVSNCSSAT